MAKRTAKKKTATKREKISPASYIVLRSLYVLLFLGIFVTVILYSARSIDRMFLSENPYFTVSVKDIEVSSDGDISDKKKIKTLIEQILTKTDTPERREKFSEEIKAPNIFNVDFEEIRERIIMRHGHKEIERIDIRRILPNKLKFNIKDRTPVALIFWGTQSEGGKPARFLIDRRGMVLKDDSQKPNDRWDNLPKIMGYRPPKNKEGEEIELTVGYEINNFALHGALKLLEFKAIHKDGDLCRLDRIQVNSKDELMLYLNKVGRYVRRNCMVRIPLRNLLTFSEEKRKATEGLTDEQVRDKEIQRGLNLTIATIKERIASQQPLQYIDTSQTGVIVK